MQLNQAGIDLVKEFEGFRPDPYLCPAGVWTIGYGTTTYINGNDVRSGDLPIDGYTAEMFLRYDMNKRAEKLVKFLKRIDLKLSPNQFSALISFAYNLGIQRVTKKGSVSRSLRRKQLHFVPKGIRKYTKARVNGQRVELRGLLRRRLAEIELFKKREESFPSSMT